MSNCCLTAAGGGGGNLGGGAGVEAARIVGASSPLSLSAHSMFSYPTDTACCTDKSHFTAVIKQEGHKILTFSCLMTYIYIYIYIYIHIYVVPHR